MALSSSDLVQRCRDILGDRPFTDSSTTTTTGTTITVADSSLYSVGAIVEWQTGAVGFEQMLVTAIPTSTTLTVVRGYAGTTAETHTSGDEIVRDPLFTGRTIQQSITQVILDSWPYIWKPGTINLTYSDTTKWYDLNAATLGIVTVTQEKNSTVTDFGRFRDRYFGGGLSYIVERDLPTAIVASTIGIYFPNGVYDSRTSGGNAIVVRDVRAITGTSDIEDSSNLPMAEALVWGACGRLLKAKEVSRITAGEPLTTSSSVGAGARFSLGSQYEQEWRRRLETLRIRLHSIYSPDDIWSY